MSTAPPSSLPPIAEPHSSASLPPEEHPLHVSLPYDLRPRSARAVRDVRLQQFVGGATAIRDRARVDIFREDFGDRSEGIKRLAGSIKQHTLDHLDWYLGRFIENARARGVIVHVARDGNEANEICASIAAAKGCKTCVKSKSMVTEETGLLPVLESRGVKTIETDLGEFIIQLDHDAPSHLVAPMIHKDRTAVGRAFTRELGVPYTEDPRELAGIARDYLRKAYAQADLGISGANFLVAETGSIVLCTNEGNGRFCTSAPPVHIAVAGIEKLIPAMEHLGVMLKVLARSATAQPLTCYTHIVTGPRRADEHDGPREVHLVLLDNGRSAMLAAETRELLRCIRCGACLNACPVYRRIGGHSYGSVYSGPIGAVITPLLKGLHNYPDLPHATSLCGACYEACPVKIDIPRRLIGLRERMVRERLAGPAERLAMAVWSRVVGNGWSYLFSSRAMRLTLRELARAQGLLNGSDPFASRAWFPSLPGPLKAWTEERDFPSPTESSFRDWWRDREGERS